MKPNRIAIVGAGAIGGLLGARLANAGAELSVLEKDARLEQIRQQGLRVLDESQQNLQVYPCAISDSADDLGPQDLIVLGMKANQIADAAPGLVPLFHSETVVMTVQNGLPWWYFERHGGDLEGLSLQSLDPGGVIRKAISIERIIGCVAYPAAELEESGLVRLVEGNRFSVGEPSGELTERVERIVTMLKEAGFKSYALTDIRSELWLKAWGALAFNPISALTGATMIEICRCPSSRKLVERMMLEAQAVAERLGIAFRVSVEKRIAGAEAVGQHKTSMLQDFESGREPELKAVLTVFVELAEKLDIEVPVLKAIESCTQLAARRFS